MKESITQITLNLDRTVAIHVTRRAALHIRVHTES